MEEFRSVMMGQKKNFMLEAELSELFWLEEDSNVERNVHSTGWTYGFSEGNRPLPGTGLGDVFVTHS